jgi:hypothetical protein
VHVIVFIDGNGTVDGTLVLTHGQCPLAVGAANATRSDRNARARTRMTSGVLR